MPQNVVLNLVTQTAISPLYLQGRSLQKLFFELVESVDPELGKALRYDEQTNFYSFSALQVRSEQAGSGCRMMASEGLGEEGLQHTHKHTLPAQTRCWWRISFVDDDLFDHLAFLWHELRGEVFQLGSGLISVSGIASDLSVGAGSAGSDCTGSDITAWTASCSYTELYAQASTQEQDIQIQFVTPTVFQQKGRDGCGHTPLPTVSSIFEPLRRCWNRHSKLAFTPHLINYITPTHFNIRTQSVQYIQHHSIQTFTGCIGTIGFQISGQSDPLIIKRINALADFAQYCSVGRGARFGMGLIKRLGSRPIACVGQPVNQG